MSISNKVIGRVLSVDNFRVFIKIDEDLRGSYTSGVNDIYEIARINSYLIIPVGSDRVVALISRVTMKEEIEFDKNSTNITLPTSARYISATMLGTIAKDGNAEKFVQGVYNLNTGLETTIRPENAFKRPISSNRIVMRKGVGFDIDHKHQSKSQQHDQENYSHAALHHD